MGTKKGRVEMALKAFDNLIRNADGIEYEQIRKRVIKRRKGKITLKKVK